MDEDELRRLIDGARGRDPNALGALFDRYYAVIYRYAFSRLGNVADAEDATAETFAAMLRSIPRFRWQGVRFEAWLFRIATSKIIDVVRRRRARHTSIHPAPAPAGATEEGDPSQWHLARERDADLVRCIQRLVPDQRDVVLLRFFADRSVGEVAQALGRSEGAVKQLQLRALANLRRNLNR